jgi:hypothetical protein
MRWLTGLFLVCAALATGARAQAQAACCSITAIDAKTEVVTAKVNASGAEFQFRVTNANLLKGLRVGQGVYANLAAKQVSLDGKSACCSITSTPAAAPLRPPVTASLPAGTALSGTGPCCTVTAVSSPSLITAQNSTGAYFTFSLNANSLFHVFVSVNQKVYANFTTKQVSLDGTSAVGIIKSLCPIPQNQPCPANAATCQAISVSGAAGCPAQTEYISTPASCKSGYYGALCLKCPPCQSPNVCSEGIAGSGTCQN